MYKFILILFLLITNKNIYSENIVQQDTIYPSFVGGSEALSKYLFPYFNYTDNLFPNNEPIIAYFDIFEDGKIINIYFEKEYYNKIFVDSIASAIKNMPKWNPAIIFGKPTKFSYHLVFYNRDRTNPTHPNFIYYNQTRIKNQQYSDTLKEPIILNRAEVMPSFKCGNISIKKYDFPNHANCLAEYIDMNLIYPNPLPENFESGKVILNFYIDIDGSVRNPKVIKSQFNDERFAEAALEVVNKMPKWTPGKQNGVPAKVYYTLPILFKKQ